MSKGVGIQVTGLKELQKKLGKLPENVAREVDAVLAVAASGFEQRAVADAPTDNGVLRQGISVKPVGLMHYEVVSAASYSPYIEWGTRSRVSVPADLQEYANQFKGGGKAGGEGEVKKLIFAWAKRVDIPEEAWYPVFIKIMTQGIHPHPFFFPQMPIAQAEVNKSLKEVVKKALSK